jgi:hypothetical protein
LNRKLIITTLFSIIFLINFVSAKPSIQIISPENITYVGNKIPVNVTSNESVDFFVKINGKNIILAVNKSRFENYLYGKKGSFNFTIWANNSNGITSANIIFSINSTSNPVNLTTCGILSSSYTEYILTNNVSTDERACIFAWNLPNISIDLNKHRINGKYRGIMIWDCPSTTIFNGDIYVLDNYYCTYTHWGSCRITFPYGIELQSAKVHLENLNIHGYGGLFVWVDGFVAENIYINSTWGIYALQLTNSLIRNTRIEFSGVEAFRYYEATGIWDFSCFLDLIIENTTITGFEYDFWLENANSNYYLRNTKMNISKVHFESWLQTRIYDQHLVKINVTDQTGKGVPAIVDIIDNGTIPRVSEEESKYISVSNPTSRVIAPTDENGTGEVWLTGKLTFYERSSPGRIEEYTFAPYNLTIKSWNTSESVTLNLTGNSTFALNVSLTFSILPTCTLEQMLDLNSDGYIDINDAIIILRRIVGLPVEVDGPKRCEGINIFSPF